jgi:hypothetical protein
MLDKAQTAIIERYGKALQFSLTYIPSDDAHWDRRIGDELKTAGIAVTENKLEGEPEYDAAVLNADRIARDIRAQHSKKI